MIQAKFNPSSVEVVDDEMILNFDAGDIEVWLKQEGYTLKRNAIMKVRIHDALVLNDDMFYFESQSGVRAEYQARQIKSFHEISKLLNEIIDSNVDRSSYIPILPNTEKLLEEIMEFHKEKLIDKYLTERNFKAIEILAKEDTLKFYGKKLF